MTPDLLPCPFCGSPATLRDDHEDYGPCFTLGCDTWACPGSAAYLKTPMGEKDTAVRRWNTRVPFPGILAGVAAVPGLPAATREHGPEGAD